MESSKAASPSSFILKYPMPATLLGLGVQSVQETHDPGLPGASSLLGEVSCTQTITQIYLITVLINVTRGIHRRPNPDWRISRTLFHRRHKKHYILKDEEECVRAEARVEPRLPGF